MGMARNLIVLKVQIQTETLVVCQTDLVGSRAVPSHEI